MRSVVNFVVFQLGWFACVLGAAHGMPIAGTAVVVAIGAWHVARAERPSLEALMIVVVAVIGAVWETTVVATGLLHYPNGVLFPHTPPYWIIAMWALFATTLNVSMTWLRNRPFLAATFGAIGGPLSYAAGFRLHAVTITNEPLAYAILAIGWAALTPLMVAIAQRLDGYGSPRHPRMQRTHA